MTAIDDLRTHLGELHDLELAGALLSWDQETMMPPRAAGARAEQLGTLARLHHERFTGAETGRLLDRAASELDGSCEDSFEASLVRVTRRDWDKERQVPTELAAELARAAARALPVWTDARERSDFASFVPALRRNLQLRLRYAECFDVAHPYDALLDDFERGLTTPEVATTFARLTDELPDLVAAIGAAEPVDDRCLHGHFSVAGQRAVIDDVLARMGFEDDAWRLDASAHPFSTEIGLHDIRLTTRYDEGYLGSALFSAMHECGHGLYEHGVPAELARTPLHSGVSLALHESQSRLWENVVGRGRPFCGWLLGPLRETFPEVFAGVDADGLWRAVNRVEPSLIRVEADEATYALHIVLRFELERALVEGELAVDDLPEAWNDGMRRLLGVEVPDDARGVLQDIHWAHGAFGYFPTYALGTIIAAQIWQRMREELPDVERSIAAGELAPLREWLGEHLHRHGRKLTPRETLRRATGSDLDVGPYLAYLRAKLGAVYGLE